MTAKEYKEYKGLRKESLIDNMDSIELILTYLSEEATKRIASKRKSQGLDENIKALNIGGNIAKVVREELQNNLGEIVVSNENRLGYEYIENKVIE